MKVKQKFPLSFWNIVRASENLLRLPLTKELAAAAKGLGVP